MRRLVATMAVVALAAVTAVAAFGSTKSVTWKLPTSSTVKIHRGDSVKWVWGESATHNVKGPGFQSSDSSTKGHTYTHKFKKAGTFKIICGIHGPSMKTTVKVS